MGARGASSRALIGRSRWGQLAHPGGCDGGGGYIDCQLVSAADRMRARFSTCLCALVLA